MLGHGNEIHRKIMAISLGVLIQFANRVTVNKMSGGVAHKLPGFHTIPGKYGNETGGMECNGLSRCIPGVQLHQNNPFCVILVLLVKNGRTSFLKSFKLCVFRTLTVRHQEAILYVACNMLGFLL
jgi:hypothetical protein